MPQYTDFVSFPKAVVWDDMVATVPSPSAFGSGNPTSVNFGGTSTIRALAFAIGDAINGMVQFSHSYKEGSLISPHVHWAPVDTDTGNVNWQLDYYWLNINQAASGSPTTLTIQQAAGGQAWNQQLVDFADIVGTGKLVSSLFMFKLSRIAATVPSYGANPVLLAFDIHYQKDSIGSRLELSK